MALWPCVLILVLPYVCPDRLPHGDAKPWLREWLSSRKYLFLGILLMPLAACVNPYGAGGALYVFRSYGAASYHDAILEMAPPPFLSSFGIMIILQIVICSVYFHKARRPDDVRLLLFSIGTALLAMMHVRNFWFMTFALVPVCLRLASVYGGPGLFESWRCLPRSGRACAFAAGALLFLCCASGFMSIEWSDSTGMHADATTAAACLDGRDDAVLFTDFDIGDRRYSRSITIRRGSASFTPGFLRPASGV